MRRTVLIAAGGTGGHLFPAEALAWALASRNWRVHLATDHRVETLGQSFPAEATHIIPSATLAGGRLAKVMAAGRLALGLMRSLMMLRRLEPDAAIGFGGYPTVPPMMAATLMRVPSIIHEQNAVLGRANQFLARRVTAVAATTPALALGDAERGKLVVTGNPVRLAVRDAAATPYPPLGPADPLRLLVFGGSQGARFLSDLLPEALSIVPKALRARIALTQQCRPEDMERVAAACRELEVKAELQPFFHDMPARIAASHLVVCRSGASTVAELAAIGRPGIMIPLPHALDQDQKANAEMLQAAGGGWMVLQRDMTPDRLAAMLAEVVANPARLEAAADAARATGRADAVDRLADLVEEVAERRLLPRKNQETHP